MSTRPNKRNAVNEKTQAVRNFRLQGPGEFEYSWIQEFHEYLFLILSDAKFCKEHGE
jgi:hypothetical protein